MSTSCNSCGRDGLSREFSFCPYCGETLGNPSICSNCSTQLDESAKFCPACGTAAGESKKTKRETKTPEVSEVGPVPTKGITVEFFYSTSAKFDFAVEAAKKFSYFKQYGEGKKALYRVTFGNNEMDLAVDLVEYLKGWRKRTVYVNGEKVTWDSVFNFAWCYNKRKSSYKPEFYCFGYDETYNINVWGCLQAHMPFHDRTEWFTWGRWLNKRGEWEFDKDRIKHELQKNLYKYRFCPAIQLGLVKDVLAALPDRVNPNKDKNWVFIESWDSSAVGLEITLDRHGYKEKRIAVGVGPKGPEVIETVLRKLKNGRIPVYSW